MMYSYSKPIKKEIKRTRGKQLNYRKRNLGHINQMLDDLEQVGLLQEQVHNYSAMYGYYPEIVLVDSIYLNRENRKFLHDKDIKQVGKRLGRSKQMTDQEKDKINDQRSKENLGKENQNTD